MLSESTERRWAWMGRDATHDPQKSKETCSGTPSGCDTTERARSGSPLIPAIPAKLHEGTPAKQGAHLLAAT